MGSDGLPETWRSFELRDPRVCILNPPKRETSDFDDETNVTFVPMAAVDDRTGSIVGADTRKLGQVRKAYTYFAENDVIFAKITPCMENGKAAVACGLVNGIGFGSTEFHVLRAGPLVISGWLHAFVRTAQVRAAAKKHMHGAAGQQRVSVEFIQQFQIPVPPLAEQERVIRKVLRLLSAATQARDIALEAVSKGTAALAAVHARLANCSAKWRPLGEVAELVRRQVKTEASTEYEEMGVRSFGNGTFKKPRLTGRELARKRVYRIHTGDLVFNNVFAWEGAVAVAQPEDQGRVGSHRFVTYIPKPTQAVSEFLCYHFLTPKGLADIGEASPGSAGRNRTLGLAKLASIRVPVPDYAEQQRFAELVKRRNQLRLLAKDIDEAARIFHDAVLAKAFRGEL